MRVQTNEITRLKKSQNLNINKFSFFYLCKASYCFHYICKKKTYFIFTFQKKNYTIQVDKIIE